MAPSMQTHRPPTTGHQVAALQALQAQPKDKRANSWRRQKIKLMTGNGANVQTHIGPIPPPNGLGTNNYEILLFFILIYIIATSKAVLCLLINFFSTCFATNLNIEKVIKIIHKSTCIVSYQRLLHRFDRTIHQNGKLKSRQKSKRYARLAQIKSKRYQF